MSATVESAPAPVVAKKEPAPKLGADGLPELGPGQPPGTVDFQKYPDIARSFVRKLATRHKGDFKKLTPAQQQMITEMSGGHGEEMLRTLYEDQRRGVAPTRTGIQ